MAKSPNLPKNETGVYKLRYAGKVYYRLGSSPGNSRVRLARELHIAPETIEILDGGEKQ